MPTTPHPHQGTNSNEHISLRNMPLSPEDSRQGLHIEVPTGDGGKLLF